MGFAEFWRFFDQQGTFMPRELDACSSKVLNYSPPGERPWLLIDFCNITFVASLSSGGHAALSHTYCEDYLSALFSSGYRIKIFFDGDCDSARSVVKLQRMLRDAAPGLSAAANDPIDSNKLTDHTPLFSRADVIFRDVLAKLGLTEEVEIIKTDGEADDAIRQFAINTLSVGDKVVIFSDDASLLLGLPVSSSVIACSPKRMTLTKLTVSHSDKQLVRLCGPQVPLSLFVGALRREAYKRMNLYPNVQEQYFHIHESTLRWIAVFLGGDYSRWDCETGNSPYNIVKFMSSFYLAPLAWAEIKDNAVNRLLGVTVLLMLWELHRGPHGEGQGRGMEPVGGSNAVDMLSDVQRIARIMKKDFNHSDPCLLGVYRTDERRKGYHAAAAVADMDAAALNACRGCLSRRYASFSMTAGSSVSVSSLSVGYSDVLYRGQWGVWTSLERAGPGLVTEMTMSPLISYIEQIDVLTKALSSRITSDAIKKAAADVILSLGTELTFGSPAAFNNWMVLFLRQLTDATTATSAVACYSPTSGAISLPLVPQPVPPLVSPPVPVSDDVEDWEDQADCLEEALSKQFAGVHISTATTTAASASSTASTTSASSLIAAVSITSTKPPAPAPAPSLTGADDHITRWTWRSFVSHEPPTGVRPMTCKDLYTHVIKNNDFPASGYLVPSDDEMYVANSSNNNSNSSTGTSTSSGTSTNSTGGRGVSSFSPTKKGAGLQWEVYNREEGTVYACNEGYTAWKKGGGPVYDLQQRTDALVAYCVSQIESASAGASTSASTGASASSVTGESEGTESICSGLRSLEGLFALFGVDTDSAHAAVDAIKRFWSVDMACRELFRGGPVGDSEGAGGRENESSSVSLMHSSAMCVVLLIYCLGSTFHRPPHYTNLSQDTLDIIVEACLLSPLFGQHAILKTNEQKYLHSLQHMESTVLGEYHESFEKVLMAVRNKTSISTRAVGTVEQLYWADVLENIISEVLLDPLPFGDERSASTRWFDGWGVLTLLRLNTIKEPNQISSTDNTRPGLSLSPLSLSSASASGSSSAQSGGASPAGMRLLGTPELCRLIGMDPVYEAGRIATLRCEVDKAKTAMFAFVSDICTRILSDFP